MRSKRSFMAAVLVGGTAALSLLSGCNRTGSTEKSEPVAVSFWTSSPGLQEGGGPRAESGERKVESRERRAEGQGPEKPASGSQLSALSSQPSSTVGSTSFGTIVGRVKWLGPKPPLEPVTVTRDLHVCAEHNHTNRTYERLIVNQSNGGIENSVVSLRGKFEQGKPLSALDHPDTLNQRHCSFEPRVMVLPVGARLAMTSEDDVMHNVHMSGAVEMNMAMNKGSRVIRRLKKPGIIYVHCDIHHWMNSYIHVVKHPYNAVTDKDGRFEMTEVPPGRHEVRLWHELWGRRGGDFEIIVHPGETTQVVFELSDPAHSKDTGRMAGKPAPTDSMR